MRNESCATRLLSSMNSAAKKQSFFQQRLDHAARLGYDLPQLTTIAGDTI